MRSHKELEWITEDQTLRELAALFAKGILRLRRAPPIDAQPTASTSPSAQQKSDLAGLEVSEETVLSVHTG